MDQQLTRTFRLVVPNCRLRILSNIAAHQPQCLTLYPSISFIELAFTVAKTLHFATEQHDATLDRVHNLVLVTRLAVVADRFERRRNGSGRLLRGFRGSRWWFGWLSFFGLVQLRFPTQGASVNVAGFPDFAYELGSQSYWSLPPILSYKNCFDEGDLTQSEVIRVQ